MTTLRLHIDNDGTTSVLVFQKFPVRIGRDESNECRLEFPFVSRRHCLLDLLDGQLVLRDEGSRRGTWIHGGQTRLQADAFHPLGLLGFEFQIGALRIRAELSAQLVTQAISPLAREMDFVGTVDLGQSRRASAFPAFPAVQGADPAEPAPGGGPVEASLQSALQAYAEACQALADRIAGALAREPARAAQLAESVKQAGSPLHLLTAHPAYDPASVEAVALQQVQHLARQCVPYAEPLATAQQVTAWLTRLAAVLGTALDGIGSLRLAYRHESGIPSTETSRLLAARLLDWTADPGALDELRVELDHMRAHHDRVVEDVGAAWDTLLALLEPAAIERAVASPFPLRVFRLRAIWAEFRRRYAQVAWARAAGSTPGGAPPLRVPLLLRRALPGLGQHDVAGRPGSFRYETRVA